MNQIANTFEHIKVIRGVSGGNITVGQIQTIMRRYHLDEAQQAILNTKLSENGIQPVAESQLPPPSPDCSSAPKTPPKKEISPEVRAERFAKLRANYQEALEEIPALARQYQQEVPLLKQAIADEAADSMTKRPDLILTQAIMVISRHRVRDYRHKGWVCGTHSSKVRDYFRRKLNFIYSTEELKALVQYCTDPNAGENAHFDQILLLMLHDMPRTIVHQSIPDYYWD